MGNEALDLDSVVSSLVYAFYVHTTTQHAAKQDDQVSVFVYLPIPRKHFEVRNDSKYILAKHGISPDLLIFEEDLSLKSFVEHNSVSVHLLDCNYLPPNLSFLEKNVTGITDHHDSTHAIGCGDMRIDMVGSCSTLVGERILENSVNHLECVPFFFKMEPLMAKLLLSSITVDTINFHVAASRSTPRDMKMRNTLVRCLRELGDPDFKDKPSEPAITALFDEIMRAKTNTSAYSVEQLLIMDQKRIVGTHVVAICAIGATSVNALKHRDTDYKGCLLSYMGENMLDLLVLMNLIKDKDGSFTRELCFVSVNQDLLARFGDAGLMKKENKLKLSLKYHDDSMILYDQGDIFASRKVVLPMIKKVIDGNKLN